MLRMEKEIKILYERFKILPTCTRQDLLFSNRLLLDKHDGKRKYFYV
ncbi:MAG: hypothetical protein RMJ51_04595 [Candidatus Calescibacterium sp.]|nr:hypothetical protein [Candidatus Calescibacterium sp.]MCX7972695.1 hypothetical protein [bacterium]MDW8195497.1 hypothetical protein [Candidatus Calescibacterium sp.]